MGALRATAQSQLAGGSHRGCSAILPSRLLAIRSSICGGRLKLKAFVIEAHGIGPLLRYLGEPIESPKRSPARDTPLRDLPSTSFSTIL